MVSNKNIKQYLKLVRKSLPCSPAVKTAILSELKQSILTSEEERDWTVEELQDRFGTPEEIGEGFSHGGLTEELRRKVRKIRVAYILSAVSLSLLIVFLLCALANSLDTSDANVFVTNYDTH